LPDEIRIELHLQPVLYAASNQNHRPRCLLIKRALAFCTSRENHDGLSEQTSVNCKLLGTLTSDLATKLLAKGPRVHVVAMALRNFLGQGLGPAPH
jgi:hypothetical protein